MTGGSSQSCKRAYTEHFRRSLDGRHTISIDVRVHDKGSNNIVLYYTSLCLLGHALSFLRYFGINLLSTTDFIEMHRMMLRCPQVLQSHIVGLLLPDGIIICSELFVLPTILTRLLVCNRDGSCTTYVQIKTHDTQLMTSSAQNLRECATPLGSETCIYDVYTGIELCNSTACCFPKVMVLSRRAD